jgi:spore coat polysaccharide biosynthesis protein SpsF
LPSDREHVMPYVWRQPELFRVWNVTHSRDLSAERWTVDDERDLAFVRAVDGLIAGAPEPERLSMYTVLAALEAHPELRALNAGTERDEGYQRSLAADAAQRNDR